MAHPYSSACKSSAKAKTRAMGGSLPMQVNVDQETKLKDRMVEGFRAAKETSPREALQSQGAGRKRGGRLDKPRRDKGGVHKRSKLNVSAPKLGPEMGAPAVEAPMPMAPSPTTAIPPDMMAGMKRGGKLKGGAESGVGRLQLSKRTKI